MQRTKYLLSGGMETKRDVISFFPHYFKQYFFRLAITVVSLSTYFLLISKQRVFYFQPRIIHSRGDHTPILNNLLEIDEATHFHVDFVLSKLML